MGLKLRHDTAANWASENPTLEMAEKGYETDTGLWKTGDGITAWTSLDYDASGVTGEASSVDGEVALWEGTGGNNLKRATGSGIATLASGVLGAVTAPSGAIVGTSDSQTLTNKNLTSGTNTFPTLNQDTTGKSAKTDALDSATTVVNVSAATAPTTGQVLTATDSTHATWQTPGTGGMSNPMTTLGDVIYENSTPAPARLAGNTSTTKKFLTQTGTGSVAAAPAWGTVAAADVSGLGTAATHAATDFDAAGAAAAAQSAAEAYADTGDAGRVPTTRQVNGHALSADVTVTKADIGLGNVTNDAQVKVTDIGSTVQAYDADLTAWAGKTAPSGAAVGTTDVQALTHKDLTDASNTFPTFNQNTTGTAAGLSGTPALPNGTTATTQTPGDNSTKLATTAYTDAAVAAGGGGGGSGDVDGPASSVAGEAAVYADATGKLLGRATGTGVAKLTSGVLGTATAGTDYGTVSPKFTSNNNGVMAYFSVDDGTQVSRYNVPGLVKVNGDTLGTVGKAISGTDYAPATSGSGILKGNGAGGFATATADTDYTTPTGTETLTNKRRQPRVNAQTSTATLTPEIASYDAFALTAQAANLTIANHSTSTPTDFEKFEVRIIPTGAFTISYGTNYISRSGFTPPTSMTSGKMIRLGYEWVGSLSKYDLVALTVEP